MKRILILLLLLAGSALASDHRPLAYMEDVITQMFAEHGLELRYEDATHPRGGVLWLKDEDPASPTQRTLIFVYLAGQTEPIFCVSCATQRGGQLVLTGFLEGFLAAKSR
jgi:hypothetical protein